MLGTVELRGLSAPPCGTGLSAALKPRYAGLPPPGFHPWRKDSRADAYSAFLWCVSRHRRWE